MNNETEKWKRLYYMSNCPHCQVVNTFHIHRNEYGQNAMWSNGVELIFQDIFCMSADPDEIREGMRKIYQSITDRIRLMPVWINPESETRELY